MATFLALSAIVVVGASAETAELETAFRQGGVAGFLSSVRELEQKQGAERTARTLVGLVGEGPRDVHAAAVPTHLFGCVSPSARSQPRELQAAAVHALGRMGKAGKAVLPELARALRHSDLPASLVSQLGPGDIPLWLAEVLIRRDDPSGDDAGSCLARRFDLQGEKRLLPLLVQAAGRADPDWPQAAEYWAVRALGTMRDAAASARPVLVAILKKEAAWNARPNEVSNWSTLRGVAAQSLGQIGAEREGTAQLLTGMSTHRDRNLRDWCALGLALLEQRKNPDRAAKALAGLLTECDPAVEAAAAQALSGMGKAGRTFLPELAKAINKGDLLFLFPEYDLGDIPLWLAEALVQSEGPSVDEVGSALSRCTYLSTETRLLPLLIQGARHANPRVRSWAIDTLGGMKTTATPARPVLVAILKEEPPAHLTREDATAWNEARGEAACALGWIGMESQDTVRLLAGMLKHPDESIWTSAAWGLAGEEGTAAIPALVEALAREQREYYGVHHHAAVVALAKIGEPAVEALIGALQSRQVVVRQRAAEALAQMQGTTKTLVALIKAAAENDDKSVRGQAKLVLQWLPGLDKDDTVVLPALACIVQDKSPKVRKEAAHLLSDITWPEGVLPQPLLDLVGDSDSSVRVAAVETLFSRRLDKRVIPALERLLDHPDKSVRGRINELLERVRK